MIKHPHNDGPFRIGANLKRLRNQMVLSLSEVSKLTGVSKTMLSQIERSESTPTISTVWKIANGLKVRFETLLDNQDSFFCEIHRYQDMTPLRDKSHLAEIYCMVPFSPSNSRGYEFFYCILYPGCNYISDGHKNSISELIFVFQGELELIVDSKSYKLSAGSAITIEATQTHHYLNNSSQNVMLSSLVTYS